jgi:hypothetical protein
MKHFIKSLLLFLPLMLISYIVLVFLWGYFVPSFFEHNLKFRIGTNGHLNSRLKEVKQSSEVDILFLGSSHTYRGFDTRVFNKHGYSSFNLGSSSQTPLQTQLLLDKHLTSLNPKLIIYEVYPKTFEIDGVESSLDIISNDNFDISSIIMSIKLNNIKVYNTLIYAFFMDILKVNANYKEPYARGNDTYISGGFVQKNISYFNNNEKYEPNIWVLDEKQIKRFENILTILKKKNIELILVQAPITSSLYKSYSNNNYFDSLIVSKHNKYYNFNEILNLNDSLHFYDSHHLNQSGVELFNIKLIEILRMNNLKINKTLNK